MGLLQETITQMVEARQIPPAEANRLNQAFADSGDEPPSEEAVLNWLAAEYDIPYRNLEGFTPDAALVAEFPTRLLLTWNLLPLRRTDRGVDVAVSRLFDPRGLDALRAVTGESLWPVLAPTDAIRNRIKDLLGVGADTLDALEPAAFLQVVDEDNDSGVDLEESAQDASIIRFVNQILTDAIDQRATDVHLEPYEEEFRVRYRIDGVLQHVAVPPQLKKYQPAVVSRLKIISELDIAERRLAQDGRIKLRLRGTDVDVRVSIIPMIHGEAVVLRLLRQDSARRGLTELDMPPRELRCLRDMLHLPHGIVLVTGPTGSGKTTTLYAALQEINDAERKIVTIEDPVEYQIRGINQIQVTPKTGLTFAHGLRAILRHDPDVLLIGEIRDPETARIAVQASLTGHLVFSTLHTNDAPGALTRLLDMGVEPYLVSSSVEGILAQRLVRILCPDCRRPVDENERAMLPASLQNSADRKTIFTAAGCPECRHTGYRGRHAIFELLFLDDNLRGLVSASASVADIRRAGREQGWQPLCSDGWRLVEAGVTSPAEVLRVSRDTGADFDTSPTPSRSAGPSEEIAL